DRAPWRHARAARARTCAGKIGPCPHPPQRAVRRPRVAAVDRDSPAKTSVNLMTKLRVAGLVAAMNRVREQWQYGLTPEEAPLFRQRIQAIIAETEQFCRAHQRTPAYLPAPSYRAYRYLQ